MLDKYMSQYETVFNGFLAFVGKIVTFICTMAWSLIFGAHKLLLMFLKEIWDFSVSQLAYLLPIIIILAVIIAANVVISKKMEEIAKMKGHRNSHAFAVCFWLGILGYVYVLCLPDLNERRLQELNRTILAERGKSL